MWFGNKDNVYLKICFNVFGDVSTRMSALINSAHKPEENTSPRPDLLKFMRYIWFWVKLMGSLWYY